MTESSNIPGGGEEPFDVEEFARQAIASIEESDWAADSLDNRVIRIEEIIAARWPRSLFLRRRLARELRASVARYPYEPFDFRERRAQAVGEQLDAEEAARRERWEAHLRQRDEPGPQDGGADPGAGFLP